jgi:hypothetical protein
MRRLAICCVVTLGVAGCHTGGLATGLCKTYADCQADELCENAECVPSAGAHCNAATPCRPGQSCCGERCSDTTCCVADFECQGGHCDNRACKIGPRPACSATLPCSSGRCLESAGLCFECLADLDCATSDLACSPSYACVPKTAGCTVASCAAVGRVCAPEQGGCRPCVSTSECGDRVCGNDGVCAPCSGAGCGLGRTCTGGHCINDASTSCTTSADCGNQICSGLHHCVSCATNGECGAGRHCDAGQCAADSPKCQDDSGCNPPQTICRAGLCETGCAAASCSPRQVCSTRTGRCVVTSIGELAMGEVCSEHAACTTNVCWPTMDTEGAMTNLCSQACVRHDDCPAEFTCYELGDGNLCVPSSMFPTMPLNVPPGGACSTDFQNSSCMTGYCDTTTLKCMQMCARDADCTDTGTGLICVSRRPFGADADNDGTLSQSEIQGFTQVCRMPIGSLPADSLCTSHENCRGGYCAQTPDFTLPPRCAQPCCTPNDCPTSRPICKPIDVWDGLRNNTTDPYGFTKICLWREYGGFKDVGEVCGADTECKSEICIAGYSGTKRCTQTCCTSRDCAAYDWAESCRPGLTGSPTLTDDNFDAIATSLGRVAFATFGTFPAMGLTPICMPR